MGTSNGAWPSIGYSACLRSFRNACGNAAIELTWGQPVQTVRGSLTVRRKYSVEKSGGNSMNGLTWQRGWDPFRELQREFGRILDTIDPLPLGRRMQVYPPVNLHDAGDRYILSAQLPGISPGDIELTITGETLTLRGERKRPDAIPVESYRRQERPMGRWSRTVTLPNRVDGTQVTASFSHGILIVTVPKADDARPRHIAVTAGSAESPA